MNPVNRKPLATALLAAFAASSYGTASGALLSLSQAPLYVTSPQKANILLVLDNSNSMDEDASGAAVGSASANSKSEIARTAAKSIVTNYTGLINLGLMAYQQNTSGGDAVRIQQLHNSPYDVSYNPSNYNAAFTGSRNSSTKRYRIANPTSAGNFIHYNVALPFYSGSNQGNGFCFSQTAVFDNGSETYPGGPWDSYRCYNSKTGTSDVLPPPNNTDAALEGYTGNFYNGQLSPTDSDLAQGILDFGRFLTWHYIGPTWFSNSNPGGGYLHVPVGNLDATKAASINTKLGTSQFVTNGPTTASLPLQNAGLTPIEGTFKTAQDYFAGALTAAANGGPQAAPPNACGKDFVVFMTDGLPSVSASGTALTNPTAAVSAAATAAQNLYSAPRSVKSYVVGFALPVGTTPGILDTIAAAGGTGTAFDANNTATLNSAFSTIFSNILASTGSSSAVALTSGSVVAGGQIFQGRFNSLDWSGDLLAYNINPATGAPTTVAWNAAQVLNGQNYSSGRNIITYKPSSQTGIPFRWPSNPASPLSTEIDVSQVTALNTNIGGTNDGAGSSRVDFLRGLTGISGFRARTTTVLGDIVNSSPVYVAAPGFNYRDSIESVAYSSFVQANAARTPMIYVGANDGMLHGFDATTGQEKLAYVPSQIYAKLSSLTSPSYSHRYFVDGSPAVVDGFFAGAWHTMLVSGLGAGGQGVFALDVTNPASFTESNAASIVKWEFSDPDLGYVVGQPSIVKLNNGVWAAVFGNGFNNSEVDGSASTSGYAYLFIVNLQTGALIRKISTKAGSTTTPNALATPTLVDTDGDGDVDIAYAGDLLGNMWKFDLCNAGGSGCSSNSTGWDVAFGASGSPLPLFVAKDASNTRQPITSGVEVTRHFSGDGYQIYFGTGKYLEASDLSSTAPQTFYSLWDQEIAPATISGRSDLQVQTVTMTTTVSGTDYRTSSTNSVAWKDPVTPGGTKLGWYMDMPATGERIVSKSVLYSGRLLFTTIIPDTTVCSSGGTGWLMELDYKTGAAILGPTFDVDGDGDIDANDTVGSSTSPAGLEFASMPSAPALQRNPANGTMIIPLNLSGGGPPKTPPTVYPPTQARSSWRQLFDE